MKIPENCDMYLAIDSDEVKMVPFNDITKKINKTADISKNLIDTKNVEKKDEN
jgi:hypothetical protein